LVGGNVEGPGAKPSDLLPLSLAACTAYDVVEILSKQRQPLRRLEVVVTWEQDPEPPWTFRSIHCRFVLTGGVDPRKADRAIELAEEKFCAVAATIRPTVILTHEADIRPDRGRVFDVP
jgi:putative redox protein